MGAKTASIDSARYGAANLSHVNWHHELVRRQHLKGSEYLTRVPIKALGKLAKHIAGMEVASESAQAIGDMRQTSFPKAAVIEPPENKAA